MGDMAEVLELEMISDEEEYTTGTTVLTSADAEAAISRALVDPSTMEQIEQSRGVALPPELAASLPRSLRDVITIGTLLARSGYFADARQEAQAVAKVLVGTELGIGAMAAMTGIHIVRGKVQIGANVLAALVKRHKHYGYRVTELTKDRCNIVFLEDGDEIGVSLFTIEDAKDAGLIKNKAGEAWTGYKRNMLFARAMSNGVRWYCPDVTMFPVYTPGELGDEPLALPEAATTGTRPVNEGELEQLATAPITDPWAEE